ncbi:MULTISPECIES: conjugal transfer protein TraF [Sphingomonas]|uniref:conjugal transfer protein TraF n=1 Tax=Sphingomonas TaxID=13687 RepID=UPI00254D39CE|nr:MULTISPECIES: conjugal transfer protein TraF [Sphingomonas]MDK8187192.1 conjugal transfer protein TraF [Sphingomonas zeae]MDK8216562.1 conjugal transfer protein TraF [Sphingomonas sp. UMB7805-LC452B]
MMTIRDNRRGRFAATLLMLLAAAAPVAAPAGAQSLDLQSAAMADAGDDAESEDQVQPDVLEASVDTPVQGDDFYCGQRRLGQWFYCERPKTPTKSPQAAQQAQASATDRMKAISKQLNELKNRAILEPTEANVIAYVRYQREQLDRASTFSDTWQRALWQNPDIDYTLQRPVSTVGKRAWTDNRSATRDQALSRIGQRYGMFYFFAQSCAACEVFSPILRSVADSHRLTVMAVSTDGGPSRTFPNYVVDSGQRERMGVPLATPALVLFDTVTRKTVPIGFGVMSADEVMERIFMLTNTKPGQDF